MRQSLTILTLIIVSFLLVGCSEYITTDTTNVTHQTTQSGTQKTSIKALTGTFS